MPVKFKPAISLVVTRRVTPVGKRTLEPSAGRVLPCQLFGLLHSPLALPSQTAALPVDKSEKSAKPASTGRKPSVRVLNVKFTNLFYPVCRKDALKKLHKSRGDDSQPPIIHLPSFHKFSERERRRGWDG